MRQTGLTETYLPDKEGGASPSTCGTGKLRCEIIHLLRSANKRRSYQAHTWYARREVTLSDPSTALWLHCYSPVDMADKYQQKTTNGIGADVQVMLWFGHMLPDLAASSDVVASSLAAYYHSSTQACSAARRLVDLTIG